jgi:protein-disulfide isomerase
MRAASRLLLGLMALLLLPTVSMSARPALWPDDMTLGNPKAKVVVVEYASLACSHCADFHNKVFPAFRKRFIDTGKVRFVYREFITRPAEIAMAGAVVARCAGKDGYFKVVEGVFAAQQEIYDNGTIPGLRAILIREGGEAGLTKAQVEACLNDPALYEAVEVRATRGAEQDKVAGTPTFLVNGAAVQPPAGREMDLATLEAAIAAAK